MIRPTLVHRMLDEGRRRVRRRSREFDDKGFTLIELLIATTVFMILGVVLTITLDTYLKVSSQVSTSYANSEQIIPVATNFQRLIRTEVEPGPPSSTGVPVPPFVTNTGTTYNSTTAATFYANVGVAGQPAKVVASLVGTTFTVTDQLANAGSCPLSTASALVCQFTTNPVKIVAQLSNVVNGSYPSTGSPTPIFTYTLLDTSGGGAGTQTTVSNPVTTFNACTWATGDDMATTCPGDTVQGVEMDLLVRSPGSKSLAPAEDDTIVYRFSSNSYLYSPTVG
jgi:type II secretory pathway pseudopilin PulG